LHRLLIGVGVVAAVAAVFFFVDPTHSVWAPKCPLYALTGVECPACGTQRALHCLVHLDLRGAMGYNPFMILSMPYALSLAATAWVIPRERCTRLRRFCFHPTTVRVYVALMLVWMVVRNVV
jgi:hypothetical protein